MLSRLGLRIVLTPLTTALVIGFLARAMRQNRMRDYMALGFVLGAGIYFYQANRMLPLGRRDRDRAGAAGAACAGPAISLRRAGDVIGFVALTVLPLLVYWYIGRVLEQSGYTNRATSASGWDR